MSHSNITPHITEGKQQQQSYDCISCGTKASIPQDSLYKWKYFTNPDKFRIQGTCENCESTTTLWLEDANGNEIIE